MVKKASNTTPSESPNMTALRSGLALQHGSEHREVVQVKGHVALPNINITNSSAIVGDNYGTINFAGDEKEKRFQRLQDSLHYRQMNSRYNEIKDTEHQTFEWILDDQSKHELSLGLRQWLRADKGIYLIEGKAGSGKSTFMKFLCTHQRTKDLLNVWSNGTEVLLLFHSFWLVGANLQYSMKGMLASLIHQITKVHPEAFDDNLHKMPTSTIYRRLVRERPDIRLDRSDDTTSTLHVYILGRA